MKNFIEVTAKYGSEFGATSVTGKMLLETTNIQCVLPQKDGCHIILKSQKFTEDACNSWLEFSEVEVEEDYNTIREMLI